jgi:hypothetical protein
MPPIPTKIETDLRNHLTNVIVKPEEYEVSKSYYLEQQEVHLNFTIEYQKYHRKGQVEHGSEITFRLDNRQDIVDSDVEAIEKHLSNIIKSKLQYDREFCLDDENSEYVFIEEIIQK